MYASVKPLSDAIPGANELNAINAATFAEANRRLAEILASTQVSFEVPMFYDRPRDIINFNLRLSGDAEL